MTPSLWTQAAATAAPDWSPVPILSLGAVFTLCTTAVGYGMLKAKVNSTVEENRALTAKVDTLDAKVDRISESLARIEGRLERGPSAKN